jgi:hypothetical protein
MTLPRIWLAICLPLTLALSSCSGARWVPGGAGLSVIPAARHAPVVPAIGGIVNTKDFVVPQGAFVKVDKNLAVFATASVSIAGTLSVPPGISVAFFTPSFTIKGAPSGLEGGAINGNTDNKHYLGPANDIVSACQIDIQERAEWIVGGGDNLAFTSDGKSVGGHKCSVNVGAAKGAQGVVLDDGATGGTYPHRYIGGNGGWIEIGSPQAIAVTEKLAQKSGHPAWRAYAPATVTLDSPLAAGNGGNGMADDFGGLTGGVWQFIAYDGGIGGSVEIAGGTIGGSMPRISAGNGGNGGALAEGFIRSSSSSSNYPLDGTASNPNGISASLTMGSGGGGGGIYITSKTPSNVWERAGNGGNPSMVGKIGAGTGCCSVVPKSPATGTANGGSLTMYLAAPGLRGPHGNNKPSRPRSGRYSLIFIYGGGDGSAWANTNYVTGAIEIPGGNGGSLTFVPPPHIPIDSLGTYGLKIQILNCCNGGGAVSYCTSGSGAGANGGNAGNLHDNGLFRYMSPYGAIYGFYGGTAGDGTPPGKGGSPGSNDEGTVLGMPGQNGVAC